MSGCPAPKYSPATHSDYFSNNPAAADKRWSALQMSRCRCDYSPYAGNQGRADRNRAGGEARITGVNGRAAGSTRTRTDQMNRTSSFSYCGFSSATIRSNPWGRWSRGSRDGTTMESRAQRARPVCALLRKRGSIIPQQPSKSWLKLAAGLHAPKTCIDREHVVGINSPTADQSNGSSGATPFGKFTR